MQSSLVVAALLSFTTWMSSVRATYGPVKSCCVLWTTTKVPLHRIVSYTIQTEEHCRIKAVRLRTVSGKTICANPNDRWIGLAMKLVDKKKEKPALATSAPTTSTPTTSTPATSTPATSTPATSTASPTSGNITQKDKETGQSLIMFCQIQCCVVPWNKNILCPTN
ncbi:unnamed protein product [Oreochromis niloticus]|nr:unnamed protein product [Mustela putorius furo]